MTTTLQVLAAGAYCSIQDNGRRQLQRHGVACAGPMDWVSFAHAQRLSGIGPPEASSRLPGLEIATGGLTLAVEGGPMRLGLAGGAFEVRIDGALVSHPASVLLEPGNRLAIKAGRTGAWFYAVPYPALDLQPIMGSLATHVRYGLGPNGGKPLAMGDRLPLRPGRPFRGANVHAIPRGTSRPRLRVILGPQHTHFDADALADFLAASFTVSLRADRMAYVLDGPRILPHSTYDIVSDATVLGSIQVPGDGAPCVLLADRPPTGGYPKIATVIRADIGRLAQCRPHDRVRFETVDVATAVEALAAMRAALDDVSLEPRPFAFDLDALARGDAASSFWAETPDVLVGDVVDEMVPGLGLRAEADG